MKKPPKEINSTFGYRTTMSSKNKDTWNFAHRYAGIVWFILV
ncbi:SdpI family protein [Clostridium ganghwense]|uniref:SdpI family protein n=2 Tax=Clostridium ganghwense TaxID=312089 RepID=A0ABT4CTF1_9CLOT|nr:SdpI family protein [Clostridium ganghwense]